MTHGSYGDMLTTAVEGLAAMIPGVQGLSMQVVPYNDVGMCAGQVLEWLDARRRDGSAKLLPAVKPRSHRHLLRSKNLF